MKIGLVGAEGTLKAIHGFINPDLFFVDIIEYPQKQSDKGFGELLNKIQKELDGIIFTGHTYFEKASQCAPASIPWTYFKRTTNSVLCALLKASMLGYNVGKITYDLPYITTNQMVDILCNKVGIDEKKVTVNRFNGTKSHEAYMRSITEREFTELSYPEIVGKFHLNHFLAGDAEICLSASTSVVDNLAHADYPAFLVEIGREDVIEALNDIRFRHMEREKIRLQDQQIAVVSFKIELVEPYTHVIQDQRQITGTYYVEKEILSFVQRIGAAVERTSELQYIVYTYKSILENETQNMKKIDFADRMLSVGGVRKIAVGVGFGETHGEAKGNSLVAKTAAKNQLSSCYYISDNVSNLRGPFMIKQEDSQRDMHKIAVERLSSEVAVGVTMLNTLIKAQKQYGFDRITVGELAEMCGVSFSKMNRIVAILEEKGYAEIVGNVSRSKTGRPRRLVELKLGFLQNE